MSTSDQQENGSLTRKQLREIRLTGATQVITPAEAAAAAAPVLPREAEPVEVPPTPTADSDVDLGSSPLTRRQAREQERIRTASVPVIIPEGTPAVADADAELAADEVSEAVEVPEVVEEAEAVEVPEAVEEAELVHESEVAQPEVLSAVPSFAPAIVRDADEAEDTEVEEFFGAPSPVSASAASESTGEVPLDVVEEVTAQEEEASDDSAIADVAAETDDDAEEQPTDDAERPVVSSAFGDGVLSDPADVPAFTPSFDELITAEGSTGSQHIASSTLIFTPSPGDGSLSGPVASTGEVLITGSYELADGIGSQGHAFGTTDGKDIDSVLIDGELPPASSPTPIAASSAVSTIKPAGEVIRPPAPEKGNKLMFTLAITAGGLALALAVALIIAFSTNVL